MSRHLSTLTLAGWLFVSTTALMSCKKEPENTNALKPEARVKLLELHLAGIPDKNIAIDHQKRTVTVRMPSTFSVDSLKADYKLTSGTRLVRGFPNDYLQVRAINKCYGNSSLDLTADNLPGVTISYTIVPVPAGKLKPNPTVPLEMELQYAMNVPIPVENLYGNEPIVDARVTREGSSEKISLLGESSPNNCVWFSYGEALNQVGVRASLQLQPGRYALELVQTDGTVVPVGQPLVVKKGKAAIHTTEWTRGVVTNESFQIQGYNLFAGDVALTLTDQTQTYRPALSNFAANGTGFEAKLPALAPGGYILKVTQNGQEIDCIKLNVLKYKNQPVLANIFDFLQNCPTYETLTLARNKRFNIFYSPMTWGKQDNLIRLDELIQLTRIDNPSVMFNVPIVPYVLNGNPESSAYFVVPASVPTGSYRVKLQVKDPQTGELSYSEVYERIIDVR